MPTFRTWNRTTAKTTYSRPSKPPANSMRIDNPASRPYALRFMKIALLENVGVAIDCTGGPSGAHLESPKMRRVVLLVLVVPIVLLLAGCGGELTTPTPETVVGTLPAPPPT